MACARDYRGQDAYESMVDYSRWATFNASSDEEEQSIEDSEHEHLRKRVVRLVVIPPCNEQQHLRASRLIESSKAMVRQARYQLASAACLKAIDLLCDEPDLEAAVWQTDWGRDWAWARYQLARVVRVQLNLCGIVLDGANLPAGVNAVSYAQFDGACEAASDAAAGYSRHFRDAACPCASDARELFSPCELQLRCARTAASPQHIYPLDSLYIEPWRLRRLSSADPFLMGYELQLGLKCDALHSGDEKDWSGSNGSWWRPHSPMAIFITGPYCSINATHVQELREWHDKNCYPSIDYPPAEMLCTCPGCGCLLPDLATGAEFQYVFLTLQYITCFEKVHVARMNAPDKVSEEAVRAAKGVGRGERLSVCSYNKMLPRYWCLRCIRDVILPLSDEYGAGPQESGEDALWAHLRPVMLADLPAAPDAYQSWVEEDLNRVQASVHAHRKHHLDHFYHTMNKRKQKMYGGPIIGYPGGSNNCQLNSSCGHCGMAYLKAWSTLNVLDSAMPKLQVCSGCMMVAYCGRACQRADWSTHKSTCRKARLESID